MGSIDFDPAVSQREWPVKRATTQDEIIECLRLRLEVFVAEQRVPLAEEVDAYDATAFHYLALDDGRPVGVARLAPVSADVAKIGRLAVKKSYRRRGVGSSLIRHILTTDAWRYRLIVLDAQVAAIGFYERFGFVAEGDVFLDCGIPHRRMLLAR